ncbi:MAG: primosomal protein N', partial [Deltaproteobacteria bacterium]|nr:primosomal protein N' [Deltaproteobacteria bacterium]
MERYVALPGSEVAFKKLSGAGKKIMAAVKDEGEISVQKLKALVPSAPRIIHSLEKGGYIKILQKKVYRDPFGEPIRSDTTHILTGEQQHAVSKVLRLL